MGIPLTSCRRAKPPRRRGTGRAGLGRAGAVLLEVVIALTIFVIAAAVLGSAMRGAIDAVTDIRLSGKAADLAQSVMAELSVGALELVETPPTAFGDADQDEPVEEGWTYEIFAGDIPDMPGLKQVTVTVRYDDPRRPQACRLTQWMLDPAFDVAAFEPGELGGIMP